jgi:acyl carrier protein
MSAAGGVAAFMRPRLATALGVTPELVTDDLELATLGLSSLAIMEIVYDAEDELGIVFPEESLESATTVGQLIAALDAEARSAPAKGAS